MTEEQNRDTMLAAVSYVRSVIEDAPAEIKLEMTHRILMEAIIFGSDNYFEGLGILEDVKDVYKQAYDDANECCGECEQCQEGEEEPNVP